MDCSIYSKQELQALLDIETKNLKRLQKKSNGIDMTRGRPSQDQLEIAMPMLKSAGDIDYTADTVDARNYGALSGLKSARTLFGDILGAKPEEVVVGDGSSLDLMYTTVQFAYTFGVLGGTPWSKQNKVKFICPAPGYDRHFAVCEQFGIEMITVKMDENGPNMDVVETLVGSDESIKGIWCVPKYSNPTGITYSDKVVERLATMKTAASDFRIFWDNAYAVHDLYDEGDKLKNIFDVARKAGTLNRVYAFTSTSKITFAGSGVSAFASSVENVNDILKRLTFKTIGPNKVNQLMHVNFLKNLDNVKKIMAKHADILRPKFELFDKKMEDAFKGDPYVGWSRPNGGYFISVNVKGCAKRIIELSAEAGVKFTPAGSTYPYKQDDLDENMRIAPSVPSLEDLDVAVDVLISAIKIARIERYMAKKFA